VRTHPEVDSSIEAVGSDEQQQRSMACTRRWEAYADTLSALCENA
jgi:hypothetical protein